MRPLDVHVLQLLCPRSPVALLERMVRPIASTLVECAALSLDRAAAFIAQYAHETAGFTRLSEDLHYKDPDRVVALFKRHMIGLTLDDVRGYIESPELFASRVYANRNGNGPEALGDGWRYRGRGLCHLTFKNNYADAAPALGLDLVGNPDQLLEPLAAARVGGWFWKRIDGNRFADRGDFEGLTRAINGGLNGIAERQAYFKRAREVLA